MDPTTFATLSHDERVSWTHAATEAEIKALRAAMSSHETPYKHFTFGAEQVGSVQAAEAHAASAWANMPAHERNRHVDQHTTSHRERLHEYLRSAIEGANKLLAAEVEAAGQRAKEDYYRAHLARKLGAS